jgi:hypothetical protein
MSRSSRRGFLLFLLLAACSPPPTPLPVDIPPTETATPEPGSATVTPAPLRIVFGANLADGIPAADLALITNGNTLEQFSTTLDNTAADLIITLGTDLPNAAQAPNLYHVSLALNPTVLPLDNPEVGTLFRETLNPNFIVPTLDINGARIDPTVAPAPSLTDLRGRYANLGFPDGFDIAIANMSAAGAPALQLHLLGLNIEPRITLMSDVEAAAAYQSGDVHVVLFAWGTPEQRELWVTRAGAENVLDLYSIPISYSAAPNVEVMSFTPLGFPIPTRQTP